MNVERTASEALHCKVGADNFVSAVLGKHTQTPLLSKMYLARNKLIHHTLRKASESSPDIQLLNLGGGLDSSYAPYVSCQYIVDLPDTFANLPPPHQRPPNCKYISCNLAEPAKLFEQLGEQGFDCDHSTVILFECVLAYIDGAAVETLLHELSSKIKTALFIAYDPICGKSSKNLLSHSYSQQMVTKFYDRKAPLLSSMPSTAEFSSRMFRCNWPSVRTYSISHALQLLLNPTERSLYVSGELFDEYAALQTLLNLYCICLAGNDNTWYSEWIEVLKHHMNDLSDLSKIQTSQQQENALQASIMTDMAHERALELYKHSSNGYTATSSKSDNRLVSIRLVEVQDIEQVVSLYNSSFECFAAADKSVKKYVTTATKQLQDLRKKLSQQSQESSADSKKSTVDHRLWVAVKSSTDIDTGDLHEPIVGTIGVKRWITKSQVEASSEGNVCSAALDRFEIVHFCVEPLQRKQGIGSQLLHCALQHCQSIGVSNVNLTLLSSFTAARALYENTGFKETGQDVLSAHCTMVHMSKSLS